MEAPKRRALAGRSPWMQAWHRLQRNRVAMASLIVVVGMFLVGILAPWLAPYSYSQQDLSIAQQGPSWAHWLGTDDYGRDLLSRLIWGARTATLVAILPVSVATILGVSLGAIAGYFGGWVETVIMRVTDFFLAFPGMLLAIFLAATLRPAVVQTVAQWEGPLGMPGLSRTGVVDYLVLLVALSAIGWTGLARLVRGQVLWLREREFVEAARAIGASEWRILFRHILPNTTGVILVVVSMSMGGAVMAESVLSFVGIGVQDPTPSWGAMIYQDYAFWRTHPHLVFIPGAVVAIVIFAFNFLGDGLNDALNPKVS